MRKKGYMSLVSNLIKKKSITKYKELFYIRKRTLCKKYRIEKVYKASMLKKANL